MVKSNLRQEPFGIEYYNLPKVERAYLLKPHHGLISKSKRDNFTDAEIKAHGWVPGPQYTTTYEWDKMTGKTKGKFLKGERVTIPGEIFKKSKSIEKCTPSPS